MADINDDGVLRLVRHIVTSLVDDQNEANVAMISLQSGALFRVTVAQRDIGKVIGASGRNARAIRTLLHGIATASGRTYQLDISSDSIKPSEHDLNYSSVSQVTDI